MIRKYVTDDGAELMLDGTAGIRVLRGLDSMDGSPTENTLDPRVGSDGSVLLQSRKAERVVTLPVFIDTDSVSVGDFAMILSKPGTLVSESNRELRGVTYESGFEAPIDENMGGIDGLGWRKFNLHLLALDPWWYSQAVTETFAFAAPTGWDDPIPWDSPIPWNGGAAAEVTVQGHAAAHPLWTVTGAVTELIVGNGTLTWTWTQDLATGAYGTVDHRPGSKSPRLGSLLNGVEESGFGLWSLLSNDSTLDWGLEPGVNDLIVSAAGTDGSAALTLWYEPRWHTPVGGEGSSPGLVVPDDSMSDFVEDPPGSGLFSWTDS